MNGIEMKVTSEKDTSVDEESETGSDTFDDSKKGVLVVLPFNKFSSPILVIERTAHLYHMQLQTKKKSLYYFSVPISKTCKNSLIHHK